MALDEASQLNVFLAVGQHEAPAQDAVGVKDPAAVPLLEARSRHSIDQAHRHACRRTLCGPAGMFEHYPASIRVRERLALLVPVWVERLDRLVAELFQPRHGAVPVVGIRKIEDEQVVVSRRGRNIWRDGSPYHEKAIRTEVVNGCRHLAYQPARRPKTTETTRSSGACC